jgi:hypothetical protein
MVRGEKMKRMCYIVASAIVFVAFVSCTSNANSLLSEQGASDSQVVSLTTTPTTEPETQTTVTTTEESTMKPPTVATTKELKYKVIGALTREHIEKRMKNYDKQHFFFYDHEMDFVLGFAYNNAQLKKKYGDDFDIISAGGNVGSSYAGAGFSAKKGQIVPGGGAHCYIVRKGAHPLTGDGWTFKISFLAQEGWRVDDFYFDQEYTERRRYSWTAFPPTGSFAIEILE